MTKQAALDFGEYLRDEGIARVTIDPFKTRAWTVLQKIPPGRYTGEDLRAIIEAHGVYPHHHNAWGALIVHAVKAGMLVKTGAMLPSTRPSSHSHLTPEYELVS